MKYRISIILFLIFAVPHAPAAEIVQTLLETTFTEETAGSDWHAERGGRAVVLENFLHLEARQGLPELSRTDNFTGGEFHLAVELRSGTESEATLYWTSRGSFRRDESNSVKLPLHSDNNWHVYDFVFTIPDMLTSMSLRFSAPDGSWDIRSLKLIRKSPPPLVVQNAVPFIFQEEGKPDKKLIRFSVVNNMLIPIKYRIGLQTEERTLNRAETVDLGVPIRTEGNLAAVNLTLHPQDFPALVVPLFLYRSEGQTDWIEKPFGNFSLEIAPDARMMRLKIGNELLGIVAPIVHRNGVIPKFTLANDSTETDLHFESSETDLRIALKDNSSKEGTLRINFEIIDKLDQADSKPLEGPVVRLFGTLRSGLLPGVEFLRAGDTSSSEIDLAEPLNDRSRPNPLWITMPLAVLETEKGGAALYWNNLDLQPTFSTPNRFDYTDDHRISLIGSDIKASLELFPPDEESATFRVLRSYIARYDFPEPPNPMRNAEEQRQLSLLALTNGLQSETEGAWGYAFESQWERKPYADMISTLARLTELGGGRSKNPNTIVSGGSDITNDAVYFLSGRIAEWQESRMDSIRQIESAINADGSFFYRTRFPEQETAASSFGYTALQALTIMEYVRLTGNQELFAVVKKSLDYLAQCKIPGGGFYRDTPFHTPDLHTAATLIWLYVWAYEFTENPEYLQRAQHFAFAGLPFIYQVSSKEHMLYGTVGKFGGENRRLPLHFGLWTVRTGIQYAYALNLLSQYDKEADWQKLALGILRATENLQYTEGSESGCVPERFDILTQEPLGYKVNPCALVSLRLALEGKTDSLVLFKDGTNRYVSPYPLRKTSAGIEAYNVPPGQKFQILYNATRFGNGDGAGIVTVE